MVIGTDINVTPQANEDEEVGYESLRAAELNATHLGKIILVDSKPDGPIRTSEVVGRLAQIEHFANSNETATEVFIEGNWFTVSIKLDADVIVSVWEEPQDD